MIFVQFNHSLDHFMETPETNSRGTKTQGIEISMEYFEKSDGSTPKLVSYVR